MGRTVKELWLVLAGRFMEEQSGGEIGDDGRVGGSARVAERFEHRVPELAFQ